jgi:hypothetical protein
MNGWTYCGRFAGWWAVWLVLLWVPGRADAWAWGVHRQIALRAMEILGKELPLPPADARGKGHLPPTDHIYHVTADRRGWHRGGAPRKVQEILWRLSAEVLTDREFVFELGRICHLMADLCQPLHTDGSAREPLARQVHPRYEKEADRDGLLCDVAPVQGAITEAVGEGYARALAVESNADFARVIDAYRGAGGYEAVEKLTQRRVGRAIAVTVQVRCGRRPHGGGGRARRRGIDRDAAAGAGWRRPERCVND